MKGLSEQSWVDLSWIEAIESVKPTAIEEEIDDEAWRQARAQGTDAASIVAARARFLRARLSAKCGTPPSWLSPHRGHIAALWGLGLVLGLVSSALGDSGTVNLLYNPLMGLLYWQFLMYLVWLSRAAIVRSLHAAVRSSWWANRIINWVSHWSTTRKAAAEQPSLVQKFWQLWIKRRRQAMTWRLIQMFHLTFCFVVVGALLGLYLRGLVKSYEFVWESTFISDPSVIKALVSAFFWLPSLLLGREIPAISGAGMPMQGAPWIHLMAVSALLYVLIPRLLLVGVSGSRVARSGGDQRDTYLLGQLAKARMVGIRRVILVSYSYGLADDRFQKLKSALKTVVAVDRVEAVSVGWEETLDSEFSSDCWVVVVFNGVQTPEHEVHGAFIEELGPRIAAMGGLLSVVVDHQALDVDQQESRELLWRKLAENAQRDLAWVDLAKLDIAGLKRMAGAIAAVSQ